MPSLGVRSPWFRRLTDGRERSSKKRFLAHSYFASRAAGLHLHDFGCGISILGIQKLGRFFAKSEGRGFGSGNYYRRIIFRKIKSNFDKGKKLQKTIFSTLLLRLPHRRSTLAWLWLWKIIIGYIELKWFFSRGQLILKLSFSEKATQIWKNLPLILTNQLIY